MFKSASRGGVSFIVAIIVLAAVPTTALTASPQELFERAETLYRQLEVVDPSGQAPSWNRVADAFSDVAMRYPESPLAAEALWRVSWIYGRRGRAGDEEAAARQIGVYRALVQKYPDSPHAPEALLFLAVNAEDEGGAHAASLYSRLLQDYPTTPQATLARNRLNEFLRAHPDVDPAVVDAPVSGSSAPAPVPTLPAAEPSPRTTAVSAPAGDPAIDPDLGDLARLAGIRYYSDRAHTRVVLDLDRPVLFETGEAQGPERLFIDLQGVGEPLELPGAQASGLEQVIPVGGDAVSRVRVGPNRPGVIRVVLDLGASLQHTLFTLENKDDEPFRIVIDVPTATVASKVRTSRRPPEATGGSISEQLGLGVRRVVIDPGHGGNDPGAIGRTGVTEKSLTLQLSRALAARLRAAGYEVLLTREDDSTVSLEERTAFANRVDADLFVSIHINSARNRNLRGFETYYLNLANDPTAAKLPRVKTLREEPAAWAISTRRSS